MGADATRYAELVRAHGLSNAHRQSIAWVPEGARVLELGCSSGFIGSILKDVKGCDVTGVEIDPAAAAAARDAGLTVMEGSLEDAEFRASIEGTFDVILAADVIEHLSDPAVVLPCFSEWLAPGGRIVLAVPNVATWTMRMQLLRGQFNYEDTGLCDRTHLRFFTWDTIHDLVRTHGWSVDDVFVDTWEVPLLQRVLFEWPLWVRHNRAPDETTSEIRRQLFYGAATLINAHQAIGKRVGKHFPNVCAKHVSLLLSQ